MKRKIIIALLFAMCLISCVMCGCKVHEHVFREERIEDAYISKSATCTESAEYYYSCRCGEKGDKTFIYGNGTGHNYSNFMSNGDGTHSKVCFNDCTHKITEDCSGGQATCTERAKCDVCGQGYGDLEEHEYKEVILEEYKAKSATCKEKAEYYLSCECGKKDVFTFEVGDYASCEYESGKCKWCEKEYKTWQEIAQNLVYNGQKTIELSSGIAPSAGFLDVYKGANFNRYNLVIPALKDADSGEYIAGYSEEKVINILNLCSQKGIDVQVRLHRNIVRSGYNVFRDSYPNIDFKDYTAFKGFYVIDEPTWNQISVLEEEYVDWFNKHYGIEACGGEAKYEFHVNFTAGYSTLIGHVLDENGNAIYDKDPVTGNMVDCLDPVKQEAFYRRYIKRYIDNVFNKVESANKHFSIDTYALIDNQPGKVIIPSEDLRETYINTYKIAPENILIAGNMPDGYTALLAEDWLNKTHKGAITARENKTAFSACILTCDESGKRKFRLPTTKADVTWQMYMNLAFGAKKLISYGYDHYNGGTYMTLGGKPLPLYHLVKDANAEISKIGKAMSAFDKWVGVKTFVGTNNLANVEFKKLEKTQLDSLTKVSSVVTDSDLVIGEMIDVDGNHGYMMVGYDDPYYNRTINASVTFNGADGAIVYRNGERSEIQLENGKFSATFNIGEGIFIIPIYE